MPRTSWLPTPRVRMSLVDQDERACGMPLSARARVLEASDTIRAKTLYVLLSEPVLWGSKTELVVADGDIVPKP
jgi:hypothetical protein